MSESLDSHRLSVRKGVHPIEPPEIGDIGFSSDRENPEFRLTAAGESIMKTVDEGDTRFLSTIPEAIDAFEDYLRAKENSVLVLEDQDDGSKLVIPHNHRWRAQYRRMTYARLKAAERHVKERFGEVVPTTLGTLTAPHRDDKGDLRPFADVLDDLKSAWDKARRVIRRYTEGKETEMLTVYEPHASGYPHLHVIVFGVALPSLGEKVTEYWTEKYVEGASKSAQNFSIRNGRSAQIESPAGYVMKYLSKTLIRESEEYDDAVDSMPTIDGYRAFSALLWATETRQYSMTEGLSEAIKEAAPENETEGNWTLLGTASGLDLGVYTGADADALGRYLAGSPNQMMPPRQPGDYQAPIPPPD